MEFIVIIDWDNNNNEILHESSVFSTTEEANVVRDIAISEGNTNAFTTQVPENIDRRWWRVSGTSIVESPDKTNILRREVATKNIRRLEESITQRRLREAHLGREETVDWLKNVDDQIAAERAKL